MTVSVKGTVSRRHLEEEGKDRFVLRFVLVDDAGTTRGVEMRGEKLLGVLNDGDTVTVDLAPTVHTDDATLDHFRSGTSRQGASCGWSSRVLVDALLDYPGSPRFAAFSFPEWSAAP